MAAPEPTPEGHMAHVGMMPFAIENIMLTMNDGTKLSIQVCSVCKILGVTCLHAVTMDTVDEGVECAFCHLDRT